MEKINKLKHRETVKKTIMGTAIIMALLGCSVDYGFKTITVLETGTAGMECQSAGDEIINYDIIVVEADDAAGMYTDFDNTTLINEHGKITINGDYSVGMEVNEAADSSATNNGLIIINGYGSFGMYAVNSGRIVNEGTININGDNGSGMFVESGATAINNGTININGYNNSGMYAVGTGSTIENNGKIYLSGSYVEETDPFFIGLDSRDNIGMGIKNGATMINRGQIIFGN